MVGTRTLGLLQSLDGAQRLWRETMGKSLRQHLCAMNVNFELQLMVSGPRDVALVLQDGTMQVARSGQRVPTERHGSIEVPEQPPPIAEPPKRSLQLPEP